MISTVLRMKCQKNWKTFVLAMLFEPFDLYETYYNDPYRINECTLFFSWLGRFDYNVKIKHHSELSLQE